MIVERYGVVDAAIRVTTGVPSPNGAARISVYTESVIPVVTTAAVSVRPPTVHTVFDLQASTCAFVPPKRARTFREMTTPSIGDSMTVFDRLSCAASTATRYRFCHRGEKDRVA